MTKVKLNENLARISNIKVYEYSFKFEWFVDMLIGLIADCEAEGNRYPMMTCLYHLHNSIPKLKTTYSKWRKCDHTTKAYELRKQVLNLIPWEIWDSFYDNVDAFLSDIDQPYEDMSSDAMNEWLQQYTAKKIFNGEDEKKICSKCKVKLKCALSDEGVC